MKKLVVIFSTLSIILTMCACATSTTIESHYSYYVDELLSTVTTSNHASTSPNNDTLASNSESNTNGQSSINQSNSNNQSCSSAQNNTTDNNSTSNSESSTNAQSSINQSNSNNQSSSNGWYTTGKIDISLSEVQKIVTASYKKPRNIIVMIGDGMGPIVLILD